MALVIVLRNISQLDAISDYEYRIQINDRVIESGIVKDHYRVEGWEALLEKLLAHRIVTPLPPAT